MRIIPIINARLEKQHACKGGNVAQNSAYLYLSALNTGFDSVSFRAVAEGMSPKKFKKLAPYMVDLYTGGPFVTEDMLKKMKKRGLFRGTISAVIKKLRPYKEKYLEPIEYKVFEIMEVEATKHPESTINEVFNSLYFKSLKRIEKAQKPLFDHIKSLGGELPEEYAQQFADYMREVVDKQVKGEPILRKFSRKEFTYKLTKLSNNVTDNQLKSQIKTLINGISGKHYRNFFERMIIKLFWGNKKTEFDTVEKVKLIRDLEKSATSKGYKKIARLCEDNINMLKGIPVYIPFSNKAFVYDIGKLLEDLPEMRAKSEILSTAKSLPNSLTSTDALVLKFKDSEPDIIGERLFNPSLVSLEHLSPQSKGGKTNIKNCALARRGPNSRRGNEPFYITLQRYPKKNQQKYANRLTALVKRGLMNPYDALSQIQQIEYEGRITLKKDKLLRFIRECERSGEI